MSDVVKLSAVPVPRWRIGEKVWGSEVEHRPEKIKCPDCLGSGRWAVSSPAGYEGLVECPRCQGATTLNQPSRVASARQLTIASIRIDTIYRDIEDRSPIEYMCEETGVGSGRLWREPLLFAAESEALEDADRRASEERKALDAGVNAQARHDFHALSRYQLLDAAIKEAELKACRAESDLSRFIEKICELETPDGQRPYLFATGSFEEQALEAGRPTSGELPLDVDMIRLLQEHLVAWNDRASQMLRASRQEISR